MKRVHCVFCDRPGERSKEHVWPRWLQEDLGGIEGSVFAGVHFGLTPANVRSERTQSGESFVLGPVCKACNEGWMAALEVQVQPLLRQLVAGDLASANWDERTSISVGLWAVKTAFALHVSSNYRRIVPSTHLAAIGLNQVIPRGVVVDIAYRAPGESIDWFQTQTAVVRAPRLTPEGLAEALATFYIIALGVGCLLLTVSWWPLSGWVIDSAARKKSHRIVPFSREVPFAYTNERTDLATLLMKEISIQSVLPEPSC